jgi:hypothetical protein
LKEVDGKLTQAEKDNVETAITNVLTELATGNKESITQKVSDLAAATQVIYKAKETQSQQVDKDITDVDFNEVKDTV